MGVEQKKRVEREAGAADIKKEEGGTVAAKSGWRTRGLTHGKD